ncbi:MAG: hypothetical protein HGA39_06850 [Coriobacteriia bacterium]|nr:hypothetical protein [Coriobacteriia bacterium]
MRRLVAVLALASLTLAVVGCTSTPTSTATTPAATAAPVVTASATPKISGSGSIFVPLPKGDFISADLQKSLDAKHAVLIYFYNSKQDTSTESRKIIDSVLAANAGLVDVVTYDISKYATWSGGVVTIDPAYASDKAAVAAVGLTRALGVTFIPATIVIDKQGYVTYAREGLIDREFLTREIFRAAK